MYILHQNFNDTDFLFIKDPGPSFQKGFVKKHGQKPKNTHAGFW
jgi:hypothetical protein